MNLWDIPATVKDGVTNVAVSVRYPDGTVIPIGVPNGRTARETFPPFDAEDGYTVVGVVVTDEHGIGRQSTRVPR